MKTQKNLSFDHPIFIGGLMKSGTSLLRVLLGQHPDLFASFETHWFSNDFRLNWNDRNSRRVDYLLRFFEITDEGEEKIICEGGKGGRGNWHFKSSTNQTPRYAQPGLPNQEMQITLELKVLADVGLVGFPNAGKSTLLSVITDAKPKIADYEFTTLKPNLGIVKYRDFRTFIMADIPGIIEGASEGKGLGHYFLRHIERNSTLLFMIPSDSDDIVTSYKILLKELKKYNPEMLDKIRLIAITKSDLLDEELTREIELEIKGKIKEEFIFISSISNTGLTELKDKIWKMLN